MAKQYIIKALNFGQKFKKKKKKKKVLWRLCNRSTFLNQTLLLLNGIDVYGHQYVLIFSIMLFVRVWAHYFH